MNKPFVMGILGLGEGRSILSAIQNSQYWRLGKICDLNEALGRQRIEEFSLSPDCFTTRYEELLADPEIDVIGIYTPDQLHAAHIKMALEAGKNVLCTKPLMVNLDEAASLLACQERTGGIVFVGQSSRYFEPLRRQRADYDQGRLGELMALEAHYISDSRWFLERDWSHKPGFSWMYNFMIHAVDLAAWYLPDISVVYGVGAVSENTKARGLSVPDTLRFILREESTGRFATVGGAYATPALSSDFEQSISCTLRGVKGASRAGYPRLKYEHHFDGNGHHCETYQDRHSYYFRFEGETHHAGEYQNYIEEMAREMLAGRTPKPDLREAIHTLAVMEAMERSMETGLPVKVADILSGRGIRL